jgi:hypothetical protein
MHKPKKVKQQPHSNLSSSLSLMLRLGGLIFLKNASKSTSEFFSIAASAIWARLLVAFVFARATIATMMIGSTTKIPKRTIISANFIFSTFMCYTMIFIILV